MYIMNPQISEKDQERLVDYVNKTHARYLFVWLPTTEEEDHEASVKFQNQKPGNEQ